jgi:hypothetical protein
MTSTPAHETAASVTTCQLASALVGLSFPARLWEVLTYADYNGASHDFRVSLRRLPPGVYGDGAALVNALKAVGVTVLASSLQGRA